MFITTATAKGARGHQEDTLINVELPQGVLLGAFDGHGGNEASQFMAENFAGLFEETGSLRLAFGIAAQHLKDYEAGTTASVVLIPTDSRTVHTAVIGDSPIIIQTDSGIWYSPDHNVRTNEIERVAAHAGAARDGDGAQQGLVQLMLLNLGIKAVVLLIEMKETFVFLGPFDDFFKVLELLFGRVGGRPLALGNGRSADEHQHGGER